MDPIRPGDYVKVLFTNEETGESEGMWVKVERTDNRRRLLFGRLDNQPVLNLHLKLGDELAVSYDNIVEHVKPSAFDQ